jgi:protein TonB
LQLHSFLGTCRALPVERLVGWAIVVALHAAALTALNAVRIHEPVASAPAMVALSIKLERDEPLRAAAPTVPSPPEIEIRVPLPDLRIETTAPITLAARVATTESQVPAVVVANFDRVADRPAEISTVEYIRAPQPRYPPSSRATREEGLVLLRVLVDERGRAQEVSVLQSSGHARLDEAARTAVRRALFKPYLEGGVARAAVVTVPIEFTVREPNSSLARR